jgi:MFS family permease
MAVPLLKGVYGYGEDDQTKYTGQFGMFYSLGGFTSLFFVGFFTSKLGRTKFLVVMEILSLITMGLYTLEILWVFMCCRFLTGVVGGMQAAVMAGLATELLPPKIGTLITSSGYSFLTLFIILAALTDTFFGGYDGLLKHRKMVLLIPFPIGIIRLILLCTTMCGIDSPKQYFNSIKDPKELEQKIFTTMKKNLLPFFSPNSN